MIRPVGPPDAKILLVGEAPGENEVALGIPFVGMAGRVLDSALSDAGIKREDCYITNVMLERPEANDFGKFYEDKGRKSPTGALQESVRRLHAEIREVNPNVVVALGEEAMRALTGQKGISDWRGSVLTSREDNRKVVPTFHPAAVSREWSFRPALVCDLKRAKEQSAFQEVRTTKRELLVAYDFSVAINALTDIMTQSQEVAFDIETESNQITCIGFAPSNRPNWAVCIPFWFGTSGSLFSPEQETALWGQIKAILQDTRIKKIAHNGMYDIEFIKRTMGFDVRGFTLDTMLAFHMLYLELPKALSFLVSLYTDHPYYKYKLKTASMDEFFLYNATDACLTMEIAQKIEQEIWDAGQRGFYQDYVHSLVDPLLAMQEKGVRFDEKKRLLTKENVTIELTGLQEALNESAGRELNVNSPKQMKEWLYEGNGGLALKTRTKKRKATGEVTVAADEETIQELYEETGNRALKTVLAIRERQKLLSTYLNIELDEDKRIRCSYLIAGTETGRLASRGTLRGTGTNLQNVPDGVIRTLFICDEGCTFINADLSQAEARVVAYLAGDKRLISVFEQGGDIHRRNAANIFNVPEKDVTEEQRQLAKRVVHASNYGMGPRTFAKQCGLQEKEAQRLLNQYFATYPGIKNWQMLTATKVQKTRRLVTPFGRQRLFFNRWQDTLIKEAYAYVPQSTVADVLNKGLVNLHARKEEAEGFDILLQVHDSLLIQCRTHKVDEVIGIIKEALSVPVEIGGRVLTIPVDVKVGKNWGALSK